MVGGEMPVGAEEQVPQSRRELIRARVAAVLRGASEAVARLALPMHRSEWRA